MPDSDGGATIQLLQPKSHAFWNQVIAFISAEWTSDRRTSVSVVLRRTYLRCSRCRVPGVGGKIDHTDDYFALVMGVASKALQYCLTNRVGGQTKGFVSKRGRWPTSPQQLFPYGPERTIVSLVDQLDTNPDAELTITVLVSVHRPLALPVLLKAQTRGRLISSVTSRLIAAATAADTDLARIGQPVLSGVKDAVARRHLKSCSSILTLLYYLAFGVDAKPLDAVNIMYHRELELFEPLDALLSLLSEPESAERHVLRVATHLWHALSHSQQQGLGRAGPPSYARTSDRLSEEVLKDPYRALKHYLAPKTRHRGCFGPECGKRVHDKTTPGAFSRCAKCRMVQYCSRECQRADWARPQFPHREICDMLRELAACAPMDMGSEDFSAACHARSFPLERVDRLIEWATNGYTSHDYAHGAPFLRRSLEPGITMGELFGIDPALKDNSLIIQVLPRDDGMIPSASEMQDELRKFLKEMEAGVPHDPDFSWK
ncbi:hypothetical protein AURDEDRAFT_160643 [Auricularia subglabra TFB-10046 SS5]|nr:hypothetical protein AURDEDRAFT_160643 [Auricularia subglabra TFB-10046 SS5]